MRTEEKRSAKIDGEEIKGRRGSQQSDKKADLARFRSKT